MTKSKIENLQAELQGLTTKQAELNTELEAARVAVITAKGSSGEAILAGAEVGDQAAALLQLQSRVDVLVSSVEHALKKKATLEKQIAIEEVERQNSEMDKLCKVANIATEQAGKSLVEALREVEKIQAAMEKSFELSRAVKRNEFGYPVINVVRSILTIMDNLAACTGNKAILAKLNEIELTGRYVRV